MISEQKKLWEWKWFKNVRISINRWWFCINVEWTELFYAVLCRYQSSKMWVNLRQNGEKSADNGTGSIPVDSTDAENRLQQIVVPSAVKVLVKRKRLTVLRQRQRHHRHKDWWNQMGFHSRFISFERARKKRKRLYKPIEENRIRWVKIRARKIMDKSVDCNARRIES